MTGTFLRRCTQMARTSSLVTTRLTVTVSLWHSRVSPRRWRGGGLDVCTAVVTRRWPWPPGWSRPGGRVQPTFACWCLPEVLTEIRIETWLWSCCRKFHNIYGHGASFSISGSSSSMIRFRQKLKKSAWKSTLLWFANNGQTCCALQIMGRPVASHSNKMLAVAFANLLTRSTGCAHSFIARSGKCSLFSLLRMLRPSIVRDSDTGPRDGITEVEFNKALQVLNSSFKVISWPKY